MRALYLRLVRFIAAILCAVSAAVLAALGFAFAEGGLNPRAAACSLAIGCAVASFTLWSYRYEPIKISPPRGWEWAPVILYTLFTLRAFLWLVFWADDEIRVLSPNNLGDISLHLTYIRAFANGIPFWPDNPILAGTKLTYPVGVDLFHSLIVLVGGNVYRTFVWIGLIGSALTGLALWRWGRAFTLAGFLCNGGLAGFAIFKTLKTLDLQDYQTTLAWKSIPLALLVTQRGLLFALPAGLALLCSWRQRFFDAADDGESAEPGSAPRRKRVLPVWAEWLLYAVMPVFHLHTFIFLSLLLLAWFIMHRPARGKIALLVGLAFVPATALVLLVTNSFRGPSVLGWLPGWMQSDPEFAKACLANVGVSSPWLVIPLFWIVNFGALPGFVVWLVVVLARAPLDTFRWSRAAVFPALWLFLLCCLVKFAPWEWDNTKLMIWSYLIILPFLWSRLLSQRPFWQRVVACVLLFGSGFISLAGGLSTGMHGFSIANRSELDPIEVALRRLRPSDRIVAHPDYNQPVLLLGHPVALGYTGHVWSHGYEFAEPQRRVTSILNGEAGWRELAQTMGCRYLFWGAQEREAYPESSQPWREEALRVAFGDWGELYDLANGPGPGQQTSSP